MESKIESCTTEEKASEEEMEHCHHHHRRASSAIKGTICGRVTCWTQLGVLLLLAQSIIHLPQHVSSQSSSPLNMTHSSSPSHSPITISLSSTSPSSNNFPFNFSTHLSADSLGASSSLLNSNDILTVDYSTNGTLPNSPSEPSEFNFSEIPLRQTNSSNDSQTPNILPDDSYVNFRDTVRFWVQRVLVPLIMLVGIIGNSITMVIMTRRRMRSSTNWYLAALAIFDMIYLIFTFILSLKHYPNAHDINYYLYWYMFPFSMMITDAASNTSVWLTVTFTIERYIAVCHPIKGKVICTESRAKRVIFCVFIVCVSITVPTPFEWIVLEKMDTSTNKTRMQVAFSELGNNATYKSIYYHLNVFLFVLLPLVLLVIFNTFLIRSVHQSTKQRSKMVMSKDSHYQPSKSEHSSSSPSSSRQEIRITVMLIAVVILFIICQTPTACILVYTVFHEPDQNSNEEYLLTGLSNIFNFLMSINAAGNFVLYCLLSQKYRRTFVNMFCPCIARKCSPKPPKSP